MGMIDMTEGEADYLKYRFKQYLGSVSREIQNRRLKEKKMGMTINNPYRTITMPKCPYCNYKHSNCSPSNDNWSKLVGMATGTGSSDVKLKCENCGEYYRVRCNIRFFGSGVEDGRN